MDIAKALIVTHTLYLIAVAFAIVLIKKFRKEIEQMEKIIGGTC